MKNNRSLFLFTTILVLTGLACSVLGGGGAETPAVQQAPTQQSAPTFAPRATEAPQTEAPQTEAPPDAEAFFTEEFETNANWSYFAVDGTSSTILEEDKPGMFLSIENSLLTVELNEENLWVYLFYDPYSYEDVRLDTKVDNRGVNNNNISLICRYNEDGWYEFNIANNGLYWILAAFVDSTGKVGYKTIYNGGSNDIKAGKATNEYTAICKGNRLSLFINGKEVNSVDATDHREGQIGVSVSSFNVLPVNVDFDYITISEP